MFLRTDEMKEYIDMLGDVISVDEQAATNHDECPAGLDTKKRLYIKNTPDAWLFYCHHCGSKGYYKKKDTMYRASDVYRTVSALGKPLKKSHSEHNRWVEELKMVLHPTDIAAWPVEARIWWLSYGLDQNDALDHSVQWAYNRLWLKSNRAWQGRGFGGDPVKYLTLTVSTAPAMFTFHEGGLLVLTEDLLSAYKVVKAGYNSLALLGTKLDVLSQTEAMCHKEVVVWLDDDHAGQTGALSIRRQLNPVTNAHNVCFKQPKECTISQIKEQINNVRTPF